MKSNLKSNCWFNPKRSRRPAVAGLLIPLVLVCFGISPKVQAVIPAPDGGYPGGNTAEGQTALFSLTTGAYNTAVGYFSLRALTVGVFNTATGAGALLSNTGDQNTATGAGALLSNATGGLNTANGAFALFSNTNGSGNTATGVSALQSNTIGSANTASGFNALVGNTTGYSNTANGVSALQSNTIGFENTAHGLGALGSNTEGGDNTATGAFALQDNTTGIENTATGFQALQGNTGNDNTAVGFNALRNNTTGHDNTALGQSAGINVTIANNVICVGHPGQNVTNSCFIGNIRGVTTQNADAIPVLIDSAGQLGTMSSSRRFKKEIKPMNNASEAILELKPVTFHYKSDVKGTPQFGLIAEEVADVNPDLVVRDKNGEIYTVRYEAVDTMLLNEFLKEHRKVQQQEATIAQLKNGIERLATHLKEHDSKIEKVSTQLTAASSSRGGLGASNGAPQMVLNNK